MSCLTVLTIRALFLVKATAGDGAPGPPDVIPLRMCTIDYERSTQVGSNPNSGLIQECLVKTGDRVKAGQVLARLFNQDALAELACRKVALESSQTSIRQREAARRLATAKLARADALFKRNVLSMQDLEIEQLEMKNAELDLLAATLARRMAESQVLQAQVLVAARDIISPHDGVVVEIYKNVGESPSSNSIARPEASIYTIFKVVKTDRMRVVGYLDAGDAWRVCPGQPVRIRPDMEGSELPIERETFTGKISFVDSEIDPKTRTCRVFAEVENRDGLLRSGLECRMEIDLGKSPARVAGKPKPPPAAEANRPGAGS
jgi:RND family efflux transporter MFP subunit